MFTHRNMWTNSCLHPLQEHMFGGSRLGTAKFHRRDIMTRINFYFFGKHKLLTTFVCLCY